MLFDLTRKELKVLLPVILIGICGTLGIDIHLASMPFIMAFMHSTKAQMQQSVSLFLLGMGASLLLYGPLSDKYGRKPIVILGLSIAFIASFSAALTTNIHTFLSMRLIQGIGSGVCAGLGGTIFADVLQGKRLAILGSYFSLVIGLSPLLAPALGGYIQHYFNWQANFVVLGSVLLIALVLYLCLTPETNHHKNQNAFTIYGICSSYKLLLLNPVFMGCTIVGGVAISISMVYATTSSFIFQTSFHLSPVAYGWATAIAGAGSIAGKIFAPYYINWKGSYKTLISGLMMALIPGIILLFLQLLGLINVSFLVILVFFTLLGQTFITPITFSKALSPFHKNRGAAGALYAGFQYLISFIVTAIISLFTIKGVTILSVAYILLSIIGITVFYWLINKKEIKSSG